VRSAGGQRFCRADYQRRERQRQMNNDEARPSPEAAREEFFPGVWSEAPTEPLAACESELSGRSEDRPLL